MSVREELRQLHIDREENMKNIQKLTHAYLKEEGPYIYISDHAIVRYMERVKGFQFIGQTDQEKIEELTMPPERIRKQILSTEEQKEILSKNIKFYKKGDFKYVINNLTLITIIKD